ncbi:MAG: ferritin family protein [Deltaproteobacteria bacterium]|nr:ferritin family protein [Deltaproteobacteria bacterium]
MPKAAKPAQKNGNAGSALTRALRFEKTGMRYFTMSAQKATDGFAKGVFALLADMERRHYEDIMAIAKKLDETGKFPAVSTVSSEGRMRLFKREYSRIKKEKTITGDAATAMRKALGFEAEGREMYARMSENAGNRQEKTFFKILSSEEQKHFDIIYEYLDFFESSGLRMGE